MPSLTTWIFAAAGLACAAGPIVIHLLNRRRYRTIHWAAMDFLREALQRNRRILEMRDIALLALRTLAVLLFGFALAQPFVAPDTVLMWNVVLPCVLGGVLCAVVGAAMWSQAAIRWPALLLSGGLLIAAGVTVAFVMANHRQQQNDSFDGSQPLHVVLVVDNSMSMGYRIPLEGTLLDRARQRAKQYIDKLPKESRVTIIPLCGSRHSSSPDPYNKEDSQQALDKIELVDRSASVQQALDQAKQASSGGPKLAKRVVLFSDQQIGNWGGLSGTDTFKDVPSMQVVDVSPPQWENAWISDFRITDGLADVETPTTFVVEVQYVGNASHRDVQVTLKVDGIEVAAKSVRLQSGMGSRQVRFEYAFSDYQPEPGQPEFVPVMASITPDNLAADDERHLIAHVVASLPVVFVDQYRDGEEIPGKNFIGETHALRKLLAPVTSRVGTSRQLISVRHVRIEDLNRELLKDARLVVVAGINNPQDAVPLLREYVEQGGQLVIAAGGDFDAVAWNDIAWLDGAGILPAPLLPEPIGQLPQEASDTLHPFFLSYNSLASHYYFRLPDISETEMRDQYSSPNYLFFKAIRINLSDATLESMLQEEVTRLDKQYRRKKTSPPTQPADEETIPSTNNQAVAPAEQQPTWLLWNQDHSEGSAEKFPEDEKQRSVHLQRLAQRTLPRALARFDLDDTPPYLVERQIGRGNVLMMASGLSSAWNEVHKDNDVFLYDRILRSMIQSTLPQRNFPVQPRITLPLAAEDREIKLTLFRPGEEKTPEILETGFIGESRRGFSIDMPIVRGLYNVQATKNLETPNDQPTKPLWQLPLTVNGQASESDLVPLKRKEFEDRFADADVRWVAQGELITLAGSQIRGQHFWKYLIFAVLVFLLVELAILAFPSVKTGTMQTS